VKLLIFDLGFYNGTDTEFYLKKGHKVIALEPNLKSFLKGRKKFKKDINKGKLILINKAIYDKVGITDFFVNDICSCEKWLSERDGSISTVVSVETTTLIELCKKYGTPHYIKVDVEGCGQMVASDLFKLKNKPQYISFETLWKTFAEVFACLYLSGYKKFQLLNQMNNLEYSSGLFGELLPDDKWFSYEELLERYMKYRDLRIIDKKELALGWLDVHASL